MVEKKWDDDGDDRKKKNVTKTTELVETWSAEVRWVLALGVGQQQQEQQENEASSLNKTGPKNGDSTVSATTTTCPPIYLKKGETRIVQLVFRTKWVPSSPINFDSTPADEPLSLTADAAIDHKSSFQVLGENGGSGTDAVFASSSALSQSEKVTSAAQRDSSLQVTHLSSLRYELPYTSLPARFAALLPDWLLSLSAIFANLVVLPVVGIILAFLGLDTAGVLTGRTTKRGRSSKRRKVVHDVKGKGKEKAVEEEEGEGEGGRRSHRRRSPSPTLVDVNFGPGVVATTKEEDEALERLAHFNTSSESDADFFPSSSSSGHPQHLGHHRRWSTSTSSHSSASEAEQLRPSRSDSTVLTFAHDLSSSVSTVVEEAKDVAWTIRRGVVLATDVFTAVVDVGRTLVVGAGDADGERGTTRVVPMKRRTYGAGEVEGEKEMEGKRAKHEEGEDVSDGGIGAGIDKRDEGSAQGSRSPPKSPSSPPKSALVANGRFVSFRSFLSLE